MHTLNACLDTKRVGTARFSTSVGCLRCHAPNLGPTRLVDPNRFLGRETIYWDSLPDFFLKSRTCTCGYGPHLIHIKRTTTGVVSIKIYTFIESHLQIQNCTFTFTNQSVEPTCSETLLVCWPSYMRKITDVLLCTYTD